MGGVSRWPRTSRLPSACSRCLAAECPPRDIRNAEARPSDSVGLRCLSRRRLGRCLRGRHPPDAELEALDRTRLETVSPLDRILRALHGWVAFGVMPLFALVNAGAPLERASLASDSLLVFAGVGAGLLFGKPLGILGFTWISVRSGLAALPREVTWVQVGVVGCIAAIGFTMALYPLGPQTGARSLQASTAAGRPERRRGRKWPPRPSSRLVSGSFEEIRWSTNQFRCDRMTFLGSHWPSKAANGGAVPVPVARLWRHGR
jgi:hypothetical protein